MCFINLLFKENFHHDVIGHYGPIIFVYLKAIQYELTKQMPSDNTLWLPLPKV